MHTTLIVCENEESLIATFNTTVHTVELLGEEIKQMYLNGSTGKIVTDYYRFSFVVKGQHLLGHRCDSIVYNCAEMDEYYYKCVLPTQSAHWNW